MVDEVEVTAEGTPLAGLSPHEQLKKAFEELKLERDAIKKEKTALSALTALQKNENDKIAASLEETKKSLVAEIEKNGELENKMELRAASAECQVAEVEAFSKDALAEAIEKNAKYSSQIVDLESALKEAKDDKEQLLKRTATLARRDQLQKANIEALTEEIDALTDKIIEFENQFSILATRSLDLATTSEKKIETREVPVGPTPEEMEKLSFEKKDMQARILYLEDSCEKMKKTENIMKDTFVETLTKHRESWLKEKNGLKKQVKELVKEKNSIEEQVKEIAELLERDAAMRNARGEDSTAAEDVSEFSTREPPGTKTNLTYIQ